MNGQYLHLALFTNLRRDELLREAAMNRLADAARAATLATRRFNPRVSGRE
jgi:hypothetical protein